MGNEQSAVTVAVDLCSSDRARWQRAELNNRTGRCECKGELEFEPLRVHARTDPHI
jgi:hypothetical protein